MNFYDDAETNTATLGESQVVKFDSGDLSITCAECWCWQYWVDYWKTQE